MNGTQTRAQIIGMTLAEISKGCSLEMMATHADCIAMLARAEQQERLDAGVIGVGLIVMPEDMKWRD